MCFRLSRLQLGQQTGPAAETHSPPGAASLLISNTSIDPRQCSDPDPSPPSDTEQLMCGNGHNAHTDLMTCNYSFQ